MKRVGPSHHCVHVLALTPGRRGRSLALGSYLAGHSNQARKDKSRTRWHRQAPASGGLHPLRQEHGGHVGKEVEVLDV